MPELRRISPGKRGQPDAVRMIARDQEGVVARAQLRAAGVSTSAIDRALRSGTLHRVYAGVYSTLAPELLAEDGLLVAALSAAGDGALLSHGTAAWRWHIIPAPPTTIEVAVPRPRAVPQGLTLHRSARLRPADLTHNGRFPTTAVPRTLLDLATRYDQSALLRGSRRSRVPPRPAPRRRPTHAETRPLRQRQPAQSAPRPRPGPRHRQEQPRAPLPPASDQAWHRAAAEKPPPRPIHRRLPLAGAPGRRRARRPPARPPPPGRRRRRPRPLAAR
jgi:Transcriptional regulator, AbiEi antitoxin